MTDSWDEYADEWDNNPDVIAYSEKAFQSLLATTDPNGARILDFGCGTGLLAARLSELAGQVVALDPSEKMIAVLQRKGLDKVIAIQGLLEDSLIATYPGLREGFDLIVASSALAFVPDFENTLARLATLLKPGGKLIQWDWLKDSEDSGPGFTEQVLSEAYRAVGLDCTLSHPFSMGTGEDSMAVVMAVGSWH